jgi:hypothetical protein
MQTQSLGTKVQIQGHKVMKEVKFVGGNNPLKHVHHL